MASSRKTGTNEAIMTYGTGKQYTSLSTWEGDTDNVLTSGYRAISISNRSPDVQWNFTKLETINFTGSGASGTYYGESSDGTKIYIGSVSGTPLDTDTLTGASSGVTADVDAVSADTGISPVLEIYGNSYDDTIGNIAGATSSSSYFRIIRPEINNFLNKGAISTKHFIYTTGSNNIFMIVENYCQVQDIVGQITANHGYDRAVFNMDTSNCTEKAYIGCVAIDSTNSGSGTINGFGLCVSGSAANRAYNINCIAHNCDGHGFSSGAYTGGIVYMYNCISVGNVGNGFLGNNTSCIAKNCGATGNVSGSNNSTMAWSGNNNSPSLPSFRVGTDNFLLGATDGAWQEQGQNLSADSAYPFNDDILGNTRTGIWDIGVHQVTHAYDKVKIARVCPGIGIVNEKLSNNGKVLPGLGILDGNLPQQLLKTVKPSGQGGDYTTLEAAVNAQEQNLVNNNRYFDVEIDGTWSSADTTAVTLHNYTTDRTHYINIYTTASARHQGIWNTSAYILTSTSASCLATSLMDYFYIDGLQVSHNYGLSSHGIGGTMGVVSRGYVLNCLIREELSSGSNNYHGINFEESTLQATRFVTVWNCIVYGFTMDSGNSGIKFQRANAFLYNNTVYGCHTGIIRGLSGTVIATNCIANSCTDNYSGTITTSYCCSDSESELSGTGDRDGTDGDVTFVAPSGSPPNFHLDSSDVNARGNGTDLSWYFTTDIDGDTRS